VWGRVAGAALRAAGDIRNRGRNPSGKRADMCGPATSIAPKSRPSGPMQCDLTAPALRLHNRNPEAAGRYLMVIATLRRGC
jgi:hypothetical protein